MNDRDVAFLALINAAVVQLQGVDLASSGATAEQRELLILLYDATVLLFGPDDCDGAAVESKINEALRDARGV